MSVDKYPDSATGFEAELRLSPRVVAASLPVLALLVYIGGQAWSQEPGLLDHTLFVLLACSVAALCWLATGWRPAVGRWLALSSLTGAIYVGHVWLVLS